MSIPVRILNVEDSENDTYLLVRHLRKAGYSVTFERVDTLESLQAALDREKWDVMVADYMLPGFSAPAAVALLRERKENLPVVIVSGAVDGGLMGMEALRNGAHDYLDKTSLARLIPAIGLAARVIAEEDRPAAHLTLCQEYMQLPEPNLAKAIYHGRQALEGAQGFAQAEVFALASLCLGTCYVQMGWAAEAVDTLRRYMAAKEHMGPGAATVEAEARLQLGFALERMHDRKGAAGQVAMAHALFKEMGMESQAAECTRHLSRLESGEEQSAGGTGGAYEERLAAAEFHLLSGNPPMAVRESLAALTLAGADSVRCYDCYGLLMRCARVQGHHKDALSFAVSARAMALEENRHDLAFRAAQAFMEIYHSLGEEADPILKEVEEEYRANGIELRQYLPMGEEPVTIE